MLVYADGCTLEYGNPSFAQATIVAIREHPKIGTILICDFDQGFKEPEMVKRRPVIVVSPKISTRPGLCTVVALSTTEPRPKMPFHCEIDLDPPLPPPWGDTTR